jgi:8-oxo-dGTP diphosphatase
MRKKYVCGFIFSDEQDGVILVRKTHPHWQRDLLNGIGGHIDGDETPLAAMHRETKEELGLPVRLDWHPFCVELGRDYDVHFFRCCLPPGVKLEMEPQNDSGEPQGWYEVKDLGLPSTQLVGNLRWLIPMALDWRRLEVVVNTPHDDITTNPAW